jgi:hypothetical protein
MKVQFFDDPIRGPVSREDVRFNRIGLYLYEDRQRVAVGFDIAPFTERPNIEVSVINEEGTEVASLNVIEALQTNFNLTMHIKDHTESEIYEFEATLYYTSQDDGQRIIGDSLKKSLNITQIGEQ